ELLDKVAVLLGPDFPVDVPRVVAVRIFAMLAEFDRLAEVRAAVHAGEEALDDVPSPQFQPRDPLDCLWMQKLSCPPPYPLRLFVFPRRAWPPQDAKIFWKRASRVNSSSRLGVTDTMRSMTWSVVTPSLSAVKLSTMRCRSTGLASVSMSSQVTCVRPCNS